MKNADLRHHNNPIVGTAADGHGGVRVVIKTRPNWLNEHSCSRWAAYRTLDGWRVRVRRVDHEEVDSVPFAGLCENDNGFGI